MAKISIIGSFTSNNPLNGQTIKTKTLSSELKRQFGVDEINEVDSNQWRENPLKLLLSIYKAILRSDNVLLLPATNGVKVIIPIVVFLNVFLKKKIHYIVIGGWLLNVLDSFIVLKFSLKKIYMIYVETSTLFDGLSQRGYENIRRLNNFKELKIVDTDFSSLEFAKPYPICTLSRVVEDKGIEDAIKVVESINKSAGECVFTLNIYGPIDPNFKNRFEDLLKTTDDSIKYGGVVPYNETTETLKDYFFLLFPTRYTGEGFPGTIIDAYSSGVPVVSSNFASAKEIIDDGETGFIYEFKSPKALQNLLLKILDNPNEVTLMKKNCNEKAKEYSAANVVEELSKNF